HSLSRTGTQVQRPWIELASNICSCRSTAVRGQRHERALRDCGCGRRTVPVLAYLLGMPARKRPTTEDTLTARRILLDGLTRDAGICDLADELAPLHPRDNTFPGEVSCTWPPTRSTGAAPAAPARCPRRRSGTASCRSAHSTAGKQEAPVRRAGR